MINCRMVNLPTREQRATSRKVLMIRLAEYRLVSDLSVGAMPLYTGMWTTISVSLISLSPSP